MTIILSLIPEQQRDSNLKTKHKNTGSQYAQIGKWTTQGKRLVIDVYVKSYTSLNGFNF